MARKVGLGIRHCTLAWPPAGDVWCGPHRILGPSSSLFHQLIRARHFAVTGLFPAPKLKDSHGTPGFSTYELSGPHLKALAKDEGHCFAPFEMDEHTVMYHPEP